MVPAHHKHHADPPTVQASPKKGVALWISRPLNLTLLALALVAVIVGAFIGINRHSGLSQKGSATVAVGSGPNKTIADYFAASRIAQAPVRAGDPGVPLISIAPPPGWSYAEPDPKLGAYAELLFDNAADPDDVPFVEFLLSRLEGAADPSQVLEYAPGELRNLPGYSPVSEPEASKLGGFDAVQLAGLYTKGGEERIIAQKTVVIPSANGLFVLQMNADAPKDEAPAVQVVTVWIDEQAKITP